ncbi:hypothetical protein Tco_0077646 [Tanacetum coccineum]
MHPDCQKFHAIYKGITRKSGENDGDVLEAAKAEYSACNKGGKFAYEHGWRVLKKHPKWDAADHFDSEDHTEIFGPDALPRPPGKTRPAKKTKSETTKSSAGSGSGSMKDVLNEELRQKIQAGEPSQFIFDDVLFFNNTCFTDMKLCDCLLHPPIGVIRWENLEILHLKKVRLDEDMIENIFSGTPCLEFEECYGYRRIDITSKTLMSFILHDYEFVYDVDNYIDGIEINAPHLLALTIQGRMCLKKLLLLNVSSLIEAELIYWNSRGFGDPHSDVLLLEEEMLKGLLESLRLSHVNDISFGAACLEVLSRLEFKGFHFFEGTDDIAPDSNSSDNDLS